MLDGFTVIYVVLHEVLYSGKLSRGKVFMDFVGQIKATKV